MSELEVPDKSIEGVGMLVGETLDNADEWARAIATPVVVAELRRWAMILSPGLDRDAIVTRIHELKAGAS
jgi:hypothetical protein